MTERIYTTQLQAGLGMQAETAVLFDLWQPGMDASKLFDVTLGSGRLPNVSARRLRNIVSECFAPRYLRNDAQPAILLRLLNATLSNRELQQLLFLYTARANVILADFVREVYWGAYVGGRHELTNDEAKDFVILATTSGRTSKRWADSTVRRVAAYLTGCCSDFGLLERSAQGRRRILPFRIEPKVAALLAYDLHFSGVSDNALASHEDWELFGLGRTEAISELRRVSFKGLLVIQAAADVIRISWPLKSIEEVANALAKG
jgi:hypothetical protein